MRRPAPWRGHVALDPCWSRHETSTRVAFDPKPAWLPRIPLREGCARLGPNRYKLGAVVGKKCAILSGRQPYLTQYIFINQL